MAKYNGHRDWNHWNVCLWLMNDEGLYNLVRDKVRSSRTKDRAAERILESLTEAGITATPDGARYTITTIRAAIREM